MAILSRQTPTRSPSFIPRYVLILAFISLALLLLFEVDNLISRTKTIVGHNLEPTPWHVFPAKDFDDESTYSRASKILQCSYLTCSTRAANTTAATTPTINPTTDILGGSTTISSIYDDPKIIRESPQCPDFYKYIYYDLKPWAKSRISRAHVTEAQKSAAFRVVIVQGKLYVDFYFACVQSRAMFTIWGLLQLLRRYPGLIPDVDLMFDCMDKPTINRTENAEMPLPIFRYCTTPQHFDIPFPDWSFWGWSEINIGPWDEEFYNIKQGSRLRSWARKWPVAYWKGNPDVSSPIRTELLQCNDTRLWRAQIFRQDWVEEAKSGFEQSKLSKQCQHRYKIYAEGYAWSVSLKYILACGSVPLIITPEYEDFFSRGLIPKQHYWPIPTFDMCRAIKMGVEWGNEHPYEAAEIGKAAQEFMGNLSMDRIYDYMYHLIREYAKLQDFVPVPPSSAQEVCLDSVLCFADGKQREFLERTTAFPSSSPPCTLPSADMKLLKKAMKKKRKIIDNLPLW
ncbi:PREDICTED: O-glucosyltransferase rumi homolog [Ipomoea nil]|uniref:O-glucosyltransferase rumi homolog n=1 Tax=Ipomoea nil TaxID=35883 RepID=UPI0009009085|nr:PREDICTED: O-glucosyltransferase rumi homolog [Ipomoea nil]